MAERVRGFVQNIQATGKGSLEKMLNDVKL